jgi:hypothetical protein
MAIRRGWLFSLLLLALALSLPARVFAAGSSGELIAAVKNVSSQADKLRSMMSNLNASQFHVVNVRNVLTSGDEAAFKTSMKKNASDISDLRDTLTHTTVTGDDGVVVPLRKVLLSKNITIDQVVGVYVGGDGQITLFYQ